MRDIGGVEGVLEGVKEMLTVWRAQLSELFSGRGYASV